MDRIIKHGLTLLICALILAGSAPEASHMAMAKSVSSSNKTAKKKAAKKKAAKKKIELSKKKLTLKQGSKVRLRVKRTTEKVKWSTSNKSIVAVKGYGKQYATVTAHGTGTALITAKVAGKKLKCHVQVMAADAKVSVSNWSWTNGTWSKENCYVNAAGTTLADLSSELSKPAPVISKLKDYSYFYIGASRTKNTAKAVKDSKVYFYHCGGSGFDWFFQKKKKGSGVRQPALQMIRSYLDQRPSGTVIIDLGGNDLDNIEAYVGFYRTLLKTFPRATFWFMGILPREKGDPTNAARKAFNKRLEKEFPGHVVNLYDKVYHMKGFKTKDGTHYGKLMSRKIYQMAMKKMGRSILVDLKSGKVKNGKTKSKK